MKTERVKYLKVDQNVPHTKKKDENCFWVLTQLLCTRCKSLKHAQNVSYFLKIN